MTVFFNRPAPRKHRSAMVWIAGSPAMEPITYLVIVWATYGSQRTTSALESIPQASLEQCQANVELIQEWQPKASARCIDGIK